MSGVEIVLVVMLAIYVLTVIFGYWANRRYSLLSGRRLTGGDVIGIFIPILNIYIGYESMNATPGCRTFVEIFYRIEYPEHNEERRSGCGRRSSNLRKITG